MEEAKEVNITYETLFELLKREKETNDLQKLDANFFDQFVDYINEKKKLLDREDSLFSYDEKKKVGEQINNAKRMIKEIYDRREKKILIWLALQKSRTKSHVMDTSSLLEHEKRFFDEIVKVLNDFRSEVINRIIDEKHTPKIAIKQEKEDKEKISKDTKLVRFLYSVPKFVGKELEEYGPFEEEDIANLPTEIAKVLIDKGRVEEVKED